jgi:hypothetical protein
VGRNWLARLAPGPCGLLAIWASLRATGPRASGPSKAARPDGTLAYGPHQCCAGGDGREWQLRQRGSAQREAAAAHDGEHMAQRRGGGTGPHRRRSGQQGTVAMPQRRLQTGEELGAWRGDGGCQRLGLLLGEAACCRRVYGGREGGTALPCAGPLSQLPRQQRVGVAATLLTPY